MISYFIKTLIVNKRYYQKMLDKNVDLRSKINKKKKKVLCIDKINFTYTCNVILKNF